MTYFEAMTTIIKSFYKTNPEERVSFFPSRIGPNDPKNFFVNLPVNALCTATVNSLGQQTTSRDWGVQAGNSNSIPSTAPPPPVRPASLIDPETSNRSHKDEAIPKISYDTNTSPGCQFCHHCYQPPSNHIPHR